MDESSRYNVLDDGTLRIEHTQDSDEGVYECVARNPVGETKANAVELRHQATEPHSNHLVPTDNLEPAPGHRGLTHGQLRPPGLLIANVRLCLHHQVPTLL